MKTYMCLVGSDGVLNPVHVVADLGVDTRLAAEGAAVAPGDNALEFSVADHGATRVTLSKREKPVRTLSSAQVGERLTDAFPVSWSHLPRLLMLHEAPSLPPGNAPVSLHTTSYSSSLLLAPPRSLVAGLKGQKERVGGGVSCCPASPASFKEAFYQLPPRKGAWMYYLHTIFCVSFPP